MRRELAQALGLLGFYCNLLAQLAGFSIENQNLIIGADNRHPIRAAREGKNVCAVWQNDVFGEIKGNRRSFARNFRETGDKGRDHDYEAANHHQSEHSDQSS